MTEKIILWHVSKPLRKELNLYSHGKTSTVKAAMGARIAQ
jgi:hypothetical protein